MIVPTRADSSPSATPGSTGSRLACASLASAQATRATSETAAAAWTEVGVRSGLLDMAPIQKNLCLTSRFASTLRRVELGEIGLAYFSPPQCEAAHRCKILFGGRSEEAKEMAMSDETQFCEARNMAKTELSWGISLVSFRPPKLSDCRGAAALGSYR
jgi:hypothetical protein